MAKPKPIPEELQRLAPLTPAVFFVLLSLADGEKHGYAIMQESKELSSGDYRMGPGTLYTTLQRLLGVGLIEEVQAPHGSPERDSRRRYYRLTGNGTLLLESEIARIESVVRIARKKKLIPRIVE